jgi:hypothetical protein
MKIKHALLGLVSALSFSVSAFAAPVHFNFDTMSLTPGAGYGTDSENLLDVVFTTWAAPGSFTLDLAGTTSKTFNIATVELRETCINPGSCPRASDGPGNEFKDLDVGVHFHSTSPENGPLNVTLIGTAIPGPVDDKQGDYFLTFAEGDYTFGNGGKFHLDLSDLTFTDVGTQTLTATITLLNAPATDVPEPASLALVGLGLAGMAARGKRRKA